MVTPKKIDSLLGGKVCLFYLSFNVAALPYQFSFAFICSLSSPSSAFPRSLVNFLEGVAPLFLPFLSFYHPILFHLLPSLTSPSLCLYLLILTK